MSGSHSTRPVLWRCIKPCNRLTPFGLHEPPTRTSLDIAISPTRSRPNPFSRFRAPHHRAYSGYMWFVAVHLPLAWHGARQRHCRFAVILRALSVCMYGSVELFPAGRDHVVTLPVSQNHRWDSRIHVLSGCHVDMVNVLLAGVGAWETLALLGARDMVNAGSFATYRCGREPSWSCDHQVLTSGYFHCVVYIRHAWYACHGSLQTMTCPLQAHTAIVGKLYTMNC